MARINYIDLGPAPPQMSIAAATAPGRALAEVGGAIEGVAQQGFKIMQQVRESNEAGTRTSFMANAEAESAKFKNSLLTRSDYQNWQPEYQQMVDGWKTEADSLDLSPAGRTVLDQQFLKWNTQQNISLETTVAVRTLEEGRGRVGNSLKYNIDTLNMEGVERDLSELPNLGYSPSQQEQVRRDTYQKLGVGNLSREIETAPEQFTEILPEQFPDLTDADRVRLESRAKNLVQEYRGAEQQVIEDKMASGTIQDSDIDQSKYLTETDKSEIKKSIRNATPPNPEVRQASWQATDNLRKLRDDPTISQEDYREIYNDTRATVLGSIPLNYQGDIKKELNYLSPAGRDPNAPKNEGVITPEDMNAVARGQIGRALDNGVFGKVGEDASKEEKEAASRMAEDLRIDAKRFIGSNKDLDNKKIREYIDSRISGSKTTNAAKSALPSMPGMGGKLRGPSAIPFGQLPAAESGPSDALLPPKDGSQEPAAGERTVPPPRRKESQKLDDYLDGNGD